MAHFCLNFGYFVFNFEPRHEFCLLNEVYIEHTAFSLLKIEQIVIQIFKRILNPTIFLLA